MWGHFALVLEVASFEDGLFGGGCSVENGHLIISAALVKTNGVASISRKSYSLDLQSPHTLPADGRLPWSETHYPRWIPGGFLEVDGSLVFVLGGNFPGADSRGDSGKGRLQQWLGVSSRQVGMHDAKKRYKRALEEGLVVAGVYNRHYFILKNPRDATAPLTSILRMHVSGEGLSSVALRNSPPRFEPGYSAAQYHEVMYVATDGHIHTLDLSSLAWVTHRVPGFVAAASGCLALYGTTLIHAFGRRGDAYLNRTQFIDTASWKLISAYPHHTQAPDESQHILAMRVLIVYLAAMILVSIASFLYATRKRRPPTALSPPEFYALPVWVEPTTQLTDSLGLLGEPEISCDSSYTYSPRYLDLPPRRSMSI